MRITKLAVIAAFVAAAFIPAGSVQALPAYTCGTVSGGSSAVHSHITDVRVGHHTTFDRFVVQFSTVRAPHYTVIPKSSTRFVLDPLGSTVTLRGTAGIKLVMHPATGAGTYTGPRDFRPAYPQLREARLLGDFEGYVTWGLGLAHQSCKRVFVLTNPTRLVIDVPN